MNNFVAIFKSRESEVERKHLPSNKDCNLQQDQSDSIGRSCYRKIVPELWENLGLGLKESGSLSPFQSTPREAITPAVTAPVIVPAAYCPQLRRLIGEYRPEPEQCKQQVLQSIIKECQLRASRNAWQAEPLSPEYVLGFSTETCDLSFPSKVCLHPVMGPILPVAPSLVFWI